MSCLKIVQRFFPKVEEVVDATRSQLIDVSAADAQSTGIKSHDNCAMAMACKRKFHLDGVIISRTKAYLVKGKRARRFQVPLSVAREIVSFDRGGGFAPGRYTLSVVGKYHKIGKVSGGHSGKTGNGKPKKFRHITAKIRTVLGGEVSE